MKLITATLLSATLWLPTLVNAGWQDWIKKAEELVTDKETQSVVSSLSDGDVVAGLKEALMVGAKRAISDLGEPGGFLEDAQVRIPLPSHLETIATTLRTFKQDALADQFEQSMNKAAEAAVPQATTIFADTIANMTLDDARALLNGPEDAATQFLRKNAGTKLTQALQPIVARTTDEAGVTSAYKALVDKAGMLSSMLDTSSMNLDQYVTEKTLDGLFVKMAEQEALIRKDPMARSTELLKKVFGQ